MKPPPSDNVESTAAMAVAAVSNSRKRPLDAVKTEQTDDHWPNQGSGTTGINNSDTNTDGNGNGSNKAPLYSKRRKKPRLSDCETKLAGLKAENEMLRRHLDNVSQRSEKFEEERKNQEQAMRSLAEEGADASKLRPLLSKFSEMYSDYGRHRDEELSFHLKQLER